MKQLFFNSKNKIDIVTVDTPIVGEEDVLIQVKYCAISPGTETEKLNDSGLITRNLKNPSSSKIILQNISQNGITSTIRKVKTKFNEVFPTGYSGAGEVIATGKNVQFYTKGDRVAYAGAPHAEMITVKENLLSKIPASVSYQEAAYGAIGCIALHGVRISTPSLGETCIVVGLGLVGLIVAQFARSNGLNVICVEPNSKRRDVAIKLGFKNVINSNNESDYVNVVLNETNGNGVDIVFLCANIKGNDSIINNYFALCRDKARVILVGVMPLNLDRNILFSKELKFMVSRSYGPGRYEKKYEEKGFDYPIGYVRWTEQRNLEFFLNAIDSKKINVDSLISQIVDFNDAQLAYNYLFLESSNYLSILLKCGELKQKKKYDKPLVTSRQKSSDKSLKIGIIGCGSFVQNNLLPNFKKLNASLYGVANKSQKNFQYLKTNYKPSILTNNYKELIHNSNIDAFIIGTRHNLHSELAIEILRCNKPVHVEKPLALTIKDTFKVADEIKKSNGLLTIGYNRRFSPLIQTLLNNLSKIRGTKHILYRINSQILPEGHWTLDPVEGGGRLIGEGCHFIDLICYISGSEVREVSAKFISSDNKSVISRDNYTITLKFENGDLGTIFYSGQGNSSLPKELLEIYVGGNTFVIDDFKELKTFGYGKSLKFNKAEKGFTEQLNNFFNAVRAKEDLVTTISDEIRVAEIINEII
ncbi:MAG: bi-domain-containing oxidoreductase [Bacteroidetes bacterium]|nr:bi-domain-containing oxidoreductase [Bacteroidota bacterium]MBU1114890.1 bi-domain-containing oxidoreductase [Bacteroidota bacterium]